MDLKTVETTGDDSFEAVDFFPDELQSGPTMIDWEQKRAAYKICNTPPLEPIVTVL